MESVRKSQFCYSNKINNNSTWQHWGYFEKVNIASSDQSWKCCWLSCSCLKTHLPQHTSETMFLSLMCNYLPVGCFTVMSCLSSLFSLLPSFPHHGLQLDHLLLSLPPVGQFIERKSHIIIINKYLSHLTMANATLAFPSQTLLPLVHVKSLIKLSFCAIGLHSYLPKLQLWEHVQSFCRWPHTLACCVGVEETQGKNTFKCQLKMAPRTTQQNSLSPWCGVRVCWILCVLSKLFICCHWQMCLTFCVLAVTT